MKIGKLIIARHHESILNKQGVWTGTRDVGLTEYGFEMSGKMGALIKGIHIDRVFVSSQMRTKQTMEKMIEALGMESRLEDGSLPMERSAAISERDYGDYTGKNKWEMEKLIGKEKFDDIRRGWDVPVPNGETLKMVYDRAVPYYLATIFPLLKEGKNVLVVSSGNAIRAMMKYIEGISDDGMKKTEMLFGGVLIYEVDADGCMVHKEMRQVESHVNA